MRYSKVQSTLWQSKKFRKLLNFDKLVFAYLLTCPHGNSAGLFEIPSGYAKDDLDCDEERYITALDKLTEVGLIDHDDHKIVFVRGFLKYNPFTNPNHAKGSAKHVETLHAERVYKEFYKDIQTHCGGYSQAFPVPLNMVSKGLGKDYQEGFEEGITKASESVGVQGSEEGISTSTKPNQLPTTETIFYTDTATGKVLHIPPGISIPDDKMKRLSDLYAAEVLQKHLDMYSVYKRDFDGAMQHNDDYEGICQMTLGYDPRTGESMTTPEEKPND